MAIYKPSNLLPDLGEIDLTQDNTLSCVVNTSGTSVKAYKPIYITQSDNREIYKPDAIALVAPIKNKGILSFALAADDISSVMSNGNDYKWKIRVYEQNLGYTGQPLTKICDGYLTGTTRYIIWTNDCDILKKERWIEFTDKTSSDMFAPLPPNLDNKTLPVGKYTERHQIDWLSDELGTYKNISKIECDDEFEYNYINGTSFAIYEVSSEHGWNNIFANPNDEIKEGTSYIALYTYNLDDYSTYTHVNLLVSSDTAPTAAFTGNKYYSPTTDLIYTYSESTSSWGTGVAPSATAVYTITSTGHKYVWASGAGLSELTATLSEKTRKVTGYDVETGEIRVSESFSAIPSNNGYYVLYEYDVNNGITYTCSATYASATITPVTFMNAVNNVYGTYVFTYDSSVSTLWTYGGAGVALSSYGISVSNPSSWTDGDTLSVFFTDAYSTVSSDVSTMIGGAPIESDSLVVITNVWDTTNNVYRLFIQPNINIQSDTTNPCEIVFPDGVRIDITKNTDTSLISNTDTTFNTLDDSMWIVTNPTLGTGTMDVADITPKRPYVVYTDFMDSLPAALFYARTAATLTMYYKEMSNDDSTYSLVSSTPVSYRDITFKTEWNSPENVQIKYYRYYLYDSNLSVVAQSDPIYDSELVWTFRGLQSGPLNTNGQSTPYLYYVTVVVVDEYGKSYTSNITTGGTTTPKAFYIQYETDASNVDMSVNFNCDTYSLDVTIDAPLYAETVDYEGNNNITYTTVDLNNIEYNTKDAVYQLSIPNNECLNYKYVAGTSPAEDLFFPPTFSFLTDFQITQNFIENIPSATDINTVGEAPIWEVIHWNGTQNDTYKMTCTSFDEFNYTLDSNNEISLIGVNSEQFRFKIYKNNVLMGHIFNGMSYYDIGTSVIGLSSPTTYCYALQDNTASTYIIVTSLGDISQPSPNIIYILKDDTTSYSKGLYKYNSNTSTFYRLTGYAVLYIDTMNSVDSTIQNAIQYPSNTYDAVTGNFLWTDTGNIWIESGDLVQYFGKEMENYWITLQLGIKATRSCSVTITTAGGLTAVDINEDAYEKYWEYVAGTHIFSYTSSVWKENDTTVDLADMGITLEGSPSAGSTFNVVLGYTMPTDVTASIVVGNGITAVTVNENTFVNVVTTPAIYTYIYSNNVWTCGGEIVTLSDLGIAITGAATEGSMFTITLSYPESCDIEITNTAKGGV